MIDKRINDLARDAAEECICLDRGEYARSTHMSSCFGAIIASAIRTALAEVDLKAPKVGSDELGRRVATIHDDKVKLKAQLVLAHEMLEIFADDNSSFSLLVRVAEARQVLAKMDALANA